MVAVLEGPSCLAVAWLSKDDGKRLSSAHFMMAKTADYTIDKHGIKDYLPENKNYGRFYVKDNRHFLLYKPRGDKKGWAWTTYGNYAVTSMGKNKVVFREEKLTS